MSEPCMQPQCPTCMADSVPANDGRKAARWACGTAIYHDTLAYPARSRNCERRLARQLAEALRYRTLTSDTEAMGVLERYDGSLLLAPGESLCMSGDLVTRTEAAHLAGIALSTLQSHRFPGGRAREAPFPEPVAYYGQSPVWRRGDVERWARTRDRRPGNGAGVKAERAVIRSPALAVGSIRHELRDRLRCRLLETGCPWHPNLSFDDATDVADWLAEVVE